jgi:hypothetical protein
MSAATIEPSTHSPDRATLALLERPAFAPGPLTTAERGGVPLSEPTPRQPISADAPLVGEPAADVDDLADALAAALTDEADLRGLRP